MAKQESIQTLLRRSLGKEAGDALLEKIDAMAARHARPAAIQKAVMAALQKRYAEQVVAAVVSGIGPVRPIQARNVQAKVKPVVTNVIARMPNIIARASGVQASPGRSGARRSARSAR